MSLPKAIILEIDGVLSDDSKRRHFLASWYNQNTREFEPDFESYHAACFDDPSNEWCNQILSDLHHIYLIFITNRPEKYWNETVYWLDKNDMPTDEKYMKLFMRPDSITCHQNNYDCKGYGDKYCQNCPVSMPDNRPSHEVKRDIYEREIAGKYDVMFVIERDEACCEMYKSLGLTVLCVK